MTFCSDEQKEKEIIRDVERNGNYYTIYYFDDSESTFFNSDKEYLKKLEDKIIKQAKEREQLEYKKIQFDKWFSFIMTLVSINVTNFSLNRNLILLGCVCLIITFYLIKRWRKDIRKVYELKKYKILLDNYKEFKENIDISKVIEFEPIYRDPVNIFTIDNFSLNDVTLMKKVLKNKKC